MLYFNTNVGATLISLPVKLYGISVDGFRDTENLLGKRMSFRTVDQPILFWRYVFIQPPTNFLQHFILRQPFFGKRRRRNSLFGPTPYNFTQRKFS